MGHQSASANNLAVSINLATPIMGVIPLDCTMPVELFGGDGNTKNSRSGGVTYSAGYNP